MKINFDSVLVDLDSKPILEGKTELTLSMICTRALLSIEQEDGSVKAKKYILAVEIHKGGEVEVLSEDIVLIKKCIGKVFGPIVVGQAFSLLEGKE